MKDDSDAKITKGPKMKEKKLKSDKPCSNARLQVKAPFISFCNDDQR